MEGTGGRGSDHRGSRPQEGVGVRPGRKLLSWGSFETGWLPPGPSAASTAQAVSPVPSSEGTREEMDFTRRIRGPGGERLNPPGAEGAAGGLGMLFSGFQSHPYHFQCDLGPVV